jgi:HD-GYP domain-containing protein (c-di-GMP phosphodiesterase class II)
MPPDAPPAGRDPAADLFESFLRVLAGAIDDRSLHTAGHIRRVTEMTMALARAVNACADGPLAGVSFTPDELDELRVACWVHDLGKVVTPDWLIAKRTKLTTVFDRVELIRTRFALIATTLPAEARPALADDLAFVERVNASGQPLDDAAVARLRGVAARTYPDGGADKPYLTADELAQLSVRAGNLSPDERRTVNDHVAATARMLAGLPFPPRLGRVPAIAAAHHERLDGSGYPNGLTAAALDVRSRILALMDVFESLTAGDRPHRARPFTRGEVLRILGEEVTAGRLDRDLFDLFVRERIDRHLDEIKAREAAGPG